MRYILISGSSKLFETPPLWSSLHMAYLWWYQLNSCPISELEIAPKGKNSPASMIDSLKKRCFTPRSGKIYSSRHWRRILYRTKKVLRSGEMLFCLQYKRSLKKGRSFEVTVITQRKSTWKFVISHAPFPPPKLRITDVDDRKKA